MATKVLSNGEQKVSNFSFLVSVDLFFNVTDIVKL